MFFGWIRSKWFVPILWILSASSPMSAQISAQKSDKITLILSHPSERSLTSFAYLIQTGKIALAPSLRVIVVYHSEDKAEMRDTLRIVAKNYSQWMECRPITGQVATENLFAPNEWTPQFTTLFQMSDGILFLGGSDICPNIYNHKTSLLCEVSPTPWRHRYETSFLYHLLGSSRNRQTTPLLAARPDYPVFGICLGAQTMNVAMGGTLHQDIPHDVYGLDSLEEVLELPAAQHKNYQRTWTGDKNLEYGNLHPLLLTPKSPVALVSAVGTERPLVSSSHHQCVAQLAENLESWATSPDGKIVEAIVHRQYPHVVGVQFHPERQGLWDKAAALPLSPGSKETSCEIFQRHQPSVAFHEAFWKLFGDYVATAVKTVKK